MVKAIIFDCFGVLVGKGFEHTYRLGGGDPNKDREFIDNTLGQANLGLITDTDFRVAMSEKLQISVAAWRDVVREAEKPDLELLEYVKQLRTKYKTAVLSNANTGTLGRKIGKDLLEACFDKVIVSADIGMVKPDPRIYQYAAEQLGVELAECVFIDDRELFTSAAQELGMQGIMYQNFDQFTRELDEILSQSGK